MTKIGIAGLAALLLAGPAQAQTSWSLTTRTQAGNTTIYRTVTPSTVETTTFRHIGGQTQMSTVRQNYNSDAARSASPRSGSSGYDTSGSQR